MTATLIKALMLNLPCFSAAKPFPYTVKPDKAIAQTASAMPKNLAGRASTNTNAKISAAVASTNAQINLPHEDQKLIAVDVFAFPSPLTTSIGSGLNPALRIAAYALVNDASVVVIAITLSDKLKRKL